MKHDLPPDVEIARAERVGWVKRAEWSMLRWSRSLAQLSAAATIKLRRNAMIDELASAKPPPQSKDKFECSSVSQPRAQDQHHAGGSCLRCGRQRTISPDASPAQCHLPRMTQFFETFVVRVFSRGYRSCDTRFRFLFEPGGFTGVRLPKDL